MVATDAEELDDTDRERFCFLVDLAASSGRSRFRPLSCSIFANCSSATPFLQRYFVNRSGSRLTLQHYLLTSSADLVAHRWSTSEVTSDSIAAVSVKGVKHMAAPVQPPCIRNYNGVRWFSQNTMYQDGEYISRLRHFWHRVEAVALEGPPRVGVP
jgi:hypothetical protein